MTLAESQTYNMQMHNKWIHYNHNIDKLHISSVWVVVNHSALWPSPVDGKMRQTQWDFRQRRLNARDRVFSHCRNGSCISRDGFHECYLLPTLPSLSSRGNSLSRFAGQVVHRTVGQLWREEQANICANDGETFAFHFHQITSFATSLKSRSNPGPPLQSDNFKCVFTVCCQRTDNHNYHKFDVLMNGTFCGCVHWIKNDTCHVCACFHRKFRHLKWNDRRFNHLQKGTYKNEYCPWIYLIIR